MKIYIGNLVNDPGKTQKGKPVEESPWFIISSQTQIQTYNRNSKLVSHPILSRNASQHLLYGTTLNGCTITLKIVPPADCMECLTICATAAAIRTILSPWNLCTKIIQNFLYSCMDISQFLCSSSISIFGLVFHCTTAPDPYNTTTLIVVRCIEMHAINVSRFLWPNLSRKSCPYSSSKICSSSLSSLLFICICLHPQLDFKEWTMSLCFSTALVTFGFPCNPLVEIRLDQGMRLNEKIILTLIIFPHPL